MYQLKGKQLEDRTVVWSIRKRVWLFWSIEIYTGSYEACSLEYVRLLFLSGFK